MLKDRILLIVFMVYLVQAQTQNGKKSNFFVLFKNINRNISLYDKHILVKQLLKKRWESCYSNGSCGSLMQEYSPACMSQHRGRKWEVRKCASTRVNAKRLFETKKGRQTEP